MLFLSGLYLIKMNLVHCVISFDCMTAYKLSNVNKRDLKFSVSNLFCSVHKYAITVFIE